MENKELIHRAVCYIQTKPGNLLSLQEIANEAGFSLNYFDTIFMQHTGFSAVQYARIFGLTRAAATLRTTDKNILDISLDYGYANPENFTRAFRAYYSVSPAEYRKKNEGIPITWHDLSSKTIVERFTKYMPQLRPVMPDTAIDWMILNSRFTYDAELTEILMADNGIFTFDECQRPGHFIVIEDYGNDVFTLDIIGGDENCAMEYLRMAEMLPKVRIGFTLPAEEEYPRLSAKLSGCVCESYSNFEYLESSAPPTQDAQYTARVLAKEDMAIIERFGKTCDCEIQVKGLAGAMAGTMNKGLMAMGLFCENRLVGMALPAVLPVRDLNFLDVGEIYLLPDYSADQPALLLLRAVIQYALANGWLPAAFRIPTQNPISELAPAAGYTYISRHMSAQLR